MLFEYLLDALRIMVLAAALVMPAACDDNKSSTQGESGSTERHENLLTLSEAEAARAGLKVEPVEQVEWALTVAAFGTVAPDRDRIAKLVPPTAGRVTEVRAALGDRVERGAMLATLDSPELGEVRAGYTQAQAELAVARASLERTQRLVTYGSLARKEAERARADYDKAQAAATAAAAKLANLRGHTAGSGGTAAALAVTAPFDGVVIEKSAVLGEYAQPYQAMFTIADLSSVWIEVDIYERDLSAVAVGAQAIASVAAYPGERFAGKVTYISSLLDRETRTTKARVELANPDGRLKPGMFADVLIETPTKTEAIRLPDAALVLLQGQMTAFVAGEEGFEARPVETGERGGGMITIRSGLDPGERVVTAGAYALKARLLKSQIGAAD